MLLQRQLQTFMIYAHSDREAVHKLYTRLTNDGLAIWFDQKCLLPGQDWKYEIRKAIRRSDRVMICLSKHFNEQGGYRHDELKLALEKANVLGNDQIFIIPVRLEECEMPESLRHLHRVDLFEAGAYKSIVRTLQAMRD